MRANEKPFCPECHASYAPAGGGHCRGGEYGGCCQTFSSDEMFDLHRVGRPGNRRCVPLKEPWRVTRTGWTTNAPMSEAAKGRARGSANVREALELVA